MIPAVVAPVFQAYVPPPLAVSVVLWPTQMTLVPEMLGVGKGFTVTVLVDEAVHPPAPVTVTVYVVVAPGLTVIAAVVAPVFHK